MVLSDVMGKMGIWHLLERKGEGKKLFSNVWGGYFVLFMMNFADFAQT